VNRGASARHAGAREHSRPSTRTERRQQRALRERERRNASAPAPATARQERNRARENSNARTNAATGNTARPNVNRNATPNAQTQQRRLSRRANRAASLSPQSARQGRFAARFAARANARTQRHAIRIAARRAWHRGLRAAFVPWYGPVFWPYAYSDIFDYTFWPDGYDDGYWAYAYDDFFDGVFWGQSGPPEAYAYAAPDGQERQPAANAAGIKELCREPAGGVTAWPFADITKAVSPTPEQQSLLDDVKSAAQKAADVFKASCPSANAYPLTPPGRLRAMMARLLATLQAVQTVRPPLEKFYDSLSDEQKARFDDVGPKKDVKQAANESNDQSAGGESPAEANNCKQPKPGLSNLPIDRIEKIVKPTDEQDDNLANLEDATNKAVGVMQAACPDDTPLTPVGRLDTMSKRLQAMIDAAKIVEGPLDDFYSSLSNEQKARFNKIGREVAQKND